MYISDFEQACQMNDTDPLSAFNSLPIVTATQNLSSSLPTQSSGAGVWSHGKASQLVSLLIVVALGCLL
ncbi:hypothetical protein BDQ17DRAFT_1367531 [Cyathus striatus]|nr:hypothetical protein BDQ17DRAFT_1367531 [Cyathus striatus]